MQSPTPRSTIAALATATLVLAACGSDGDEIAEESTDPAAPAAADVPTIVVTTNILGDVVETVVGDAAEVVTIMPVGADPHDFQASAQEIDQLMNADALVVNGASFEEGLLDVIENAEGEGVPTFEAISVVETIEFGEGGHDHGADEHSDDEHSDDEHSDDEHSDEEHSDEEKHSADEEHADEDHDHGDEEHSADEEHSDDEKHSDEDHADEEHSDDEEHADDDHDHGHDHDGADPHFFTDPMRMADAVEGIVEFLQAELDLADPAALQASADAYVAELEAVDAAVADLVAGIPEGDRVLVTNHEVFGYFADRYGFEVVGTVIPGGTTTDGANARELAELATTIEAEGVMAIFADTSSSDQLAQTLADEVGDIAVVELYSESLGDADSDGASYLEMIRTNGSRISAALT